mgnify:CR=1 FL=1|tara:strand:- start:15859 stop:16842 length:984 start_codon:yes stop_codon:yes gene_type:complete
MTRQNIGIGASANDGSGDTLRAAGTKINDNFVELYLKLGGDSDALTSVDIGVNSVIFEGSAVDDYETTITVTNPTADRTITFPNADGNVVLDSVTQTLSNKTLTGPIITLPKINDTSADHQYVFAVSELAADRIVTLPPLTTGDTIVFNDHTATLTNKTLTTPVVTTGKFITSLNDTNGNELIKVTATGSAVNEITVVNAATGNSPTVTASGGDANVNLTLAAKGTGSVVISKTAINSETLTANGAASLTVGYTICNKGTALALSLANGTTVGETKYFTNKGAGIATITPTSFAQGSTFALDQYDAATVIWDGTNWYVAGQYGATIA